MWRRYNADIVRATRSTLLRLSGAVAATVALSASMLAGQRNEKKDDNPQRPKFTLRAQPQVAVAPARVVFTAELIGGADDYPDYYCPTIEWEWGDDTSSESATDCEPYEPGKSQIKRRYTIQHQYRRAGAFRVFIHMKQKDRFLGSASTTIQIQEGFGPGHD